MSISINFVWFGGLGGGLMWEQWIFRMGGDCGSGETSVLATVGFGGQDIMVC